MALLSQPVPNKFTNRCLSADDTRLILPFLHLLLAWQTDYAHTAPRAHVDIFKDDFHAHGALTFAFLHYNYIFNKLKLIN